MVPGGERDFRKLWVGQTISEVGSRITREGLPLTAVLLLHASPSKMGILAAVSGASVLAFGAGAGILADRLRRRPIMIICDLGRALLLCSIPVAAWMGMLGFSGLLVVALLAGVLTVQFDVAYQTYLPSLVAREDLLEDNRRLTMSASAAEILGPAMTGVLIQALTAPRAILLDAISFVVSAVSVWAIRTPEPLPERTAHESLAAEAVAGARTVWAHPVLRILALRSMTTFFSMGVFFSLYVIYAMDVLKLSTASLGLTIAMGGVGSLAGAHFSSRLARRYGGLRTLAGAALLSGTVHLLIPAAASMPALAVAFLGAAQLFGDAGWAVSFVNETTLRQQMVDGAVLGRVNAAMQVASRGVLPLGALTAGFMAERIGITSTLWLGCAGALASCLWLFALPLNRTAHADVVP